MNLFSWYWLFVVVIAVLYTALMLWFMVGWNKVSYFSSQKKVFTTKVTVIVPFYNEAFRIKKCLQGLLNQNIKTTEYNIFAINDNSTDKSPQIVERLAKEYNFLTLVNSEGKGKKAALAQAIEMAVGDLIVTTDADCTYEKDWLATIVDYYEEYNPQMIIGTVFMNAGKGFLNAFQQLEFNSLIMTSAGAAGISHPIMCNGANLAFKKDAFLALENPLNDAYVSGDDVFFMHALKKEDSDEIHFLKSHNAAVTTFGATGLKFFFKQRQRWVSKANGYKDGDTVFTAGIVFIMSLMLVSGALLLFINLQFIKPLVFLFLIKTLIDFLFFKQTQAYFRHKALMPFIPLFEIIYAIYVTVVGLLGLIQTKKYRV